MPLTIPVREHATVTQVFYRCNLTISCRHILWLRDDFAQTKINYCTAHANEEQKIGSKCLGWWNKYYRGVAVLSGVLFLSGGLVYNECRKFRERLRTLPDVFALEKQVNRYIYVANRPENSDRLHAHLPSAADQHPYALLRFVSSNNERIRQMALKILVKISPHLSDADCLMVAQAVDLPTAVRLARLKQVDLRLFRKPPPLPVVANMVSADDELRTLVTSLPSSDIGLCTKHFSDLVLKRRKRRTESSAHREGIWNFDAVEATAFHPLVKHRQPVDVVCLLQALLGHCQLKDHCTEAVSKGALYVLRHLLKVYGDVQTVVHAIARVIACMSVYTELHHDLFMAGWVTILVEWLHSPNLALSLLATKALANMDTERSRVHQVYADKVFVYHPQYSGDGSPIHADIVFVHGLLGGPFLTWRQQDLKDCLPSGSANKLTSTSSKENSMPHTDCWPKDWLAGDFPHARLLGVEYETKLSDWAPKCPYELQRRSLEVRSHELLHQLQAAGVGSRPIVWIGHSMGGLLIKQMLVLANEDVAQRHLVENTRGIVFYSVPHNGSSLAEYSLRLGAAQVLYPSVEVRELRPGSEKLKSLHDKFASLLQGRHICLTSFAEAEATNLPLNFKATIVPQDSSDPGFGEFYVMPGLNHLNICKPALRTSPLYQHTLQLIHKSLSVAGGQHTA